MMWTFLAAGALALVPILIHLFNRTRYRKVEWAAMEFLLNAYKKTRKRMQFENLLLLLLRVLAMLFLAFAFFPQGVASATQWFLDSTGISLAKSANLGRSRHLILVLDDTASMHYSEFNASSYERAQKSITKLFADLELKDGKDRVTLIRASMSSLHQPNNTQEQNSQQQSNTREKLKREIMTFDVKKARDHIQKSKASHASASLFPALREATQRLESLDLEQELPILAVVSDFQAQAWSFAQQNNPQHQAFLQLMEKAGVLLEEQGGTLSFHDVSQESQENLAIMNLQVEDPVLGVGISTALEVQVGYFGAQSSSKKSLRLQYRIDGGEAHLLREKIELRSGEIRSVWQPLPAFSEAGYHTLEVEIVGGDKSFENDNHRILALNVVEELPILIVNGDSQEDVLKDEAEYLRLALEIHQGDGDDAGRVTPNSVHVVKPKFLNITSLDQFSTIIVANLADPSPGFVDKLYEYVGEKGGTLLFTMGNKINIETYNKLLWKSGSGLLPAKLDTIHGALGSKNTEEVKLYGIKGVDIGATSPLSYFGEKDSYRQLLEAPQVFHTWLGLQKESLKSSKTDSQARVLLSLNNDDLSPLLVERPFKRGKVLLWTSSVDGDWHELWASTNLPIWLFQELTRYMAMGEAGRRDLTIGEPFIRLLGEQEQTSGGNLIENPIGISDQPSSLALLDGRKRLSYSRTSLPGIYRFQSFGHQKNDKEEKKVREELFSVNLASEETNLSRLGFQSTKSSKTPEDILTQAFKNKIKFHFEASKESDDKKKPFKDSSDKMDLWLLFLGASAFFLLAEMAASLWLGKRSDFLEHDA